MLMSVFGDKKSWLILMMPTWVVSFKSERYPTMSLSVAALAGKAFEPMVRYLTSCDSGTNIPRVGGVVAASKVTYDNVSLESLKFGSILTPALTQVVIVLVLTSIPQIS